jgi:hypothetical protein
MVTGAAIAVFGVIVGWFLRGLTAVEPVVERAVQAVRPKAHVSGKRAPRFQDDRKAWEAERAEQR